MTQNIYASEKFFEEYGRLRRSEEELDGAPGMARATRSAFGPARAQGFGLWLWLEMVLQGAEECSGVSPRPATTFCACAITPAGEDHLLRSAVDPRSPAGRPPRCVMNV
jgi:hypothetical protein